MGGRKSYSSTRVVGYGKTGSTGFSNLKSAISENKGSKEIVQLSLETFSNASPMINTIVSATKMIKITSEIYNKSMQEYEKTKDVNKAISKAAGLAMEKAKEYTKDEITKIAVTKVWEATKATSGLPSNATTDQIVVDSAHKVLKEAFKDDKRE